MERIPDREEPAIVTETEFIDSPFVELTNDNKFIIDMMYPKLGMTNAESQCFVRKEVYTRLMDATSYLPSGYRLKLLDGWRSFALQYELYYGYSDDITKEYHLDRCTDEEKWTVIKRFVSEPVGNRFLPPVHTTGGAVDVTIVDDKGNELEMGTEFDSFSDMTHTAYFENKQNVQIRDNRRLLYHAMTKSGFTNLPSEWWHFDYGDRFWAYYTGKPAMYKGMFTKNELHIGKKNREEILFYEK